MIKNEDTYSVKELAWKLREFCPDLTQSRASKVISGIFKFIKDSMICDKKVKVKGFCTFQVSRRKACKKYDFYRKKRFMFPARRMPKAIFSRDFKMTDLPGRQRKERNKNKLNLSIRYN